MKKIEQKKMKCSKWFESLEIQFVERLKHLKKVKVNLKKKMA